VNKTARAASPFQAEPRRYTIVWIDGTEAEFDTPRGHIDKGVLHLEAAAPDGQMLFLPIYSIRSWWSDPIYPPDLTP
jgi:hypothetical protein